MNKLDQKLINNFHEFGFLVLPPDNLIFNLQEINSIIDMGLKMLPSYHDGKVDPLKNNSRVDSRFNISWKYNESVSLFGCALRHRFHRGHGSVCSELDDNFFYGKRATVSERSFPTKLLQIFEKKSLINLLEDIFGEKNVSFHNASISNVFPGCTGESKQLHIDTPGFTPNRNDLLSEGEYLINVMIFLTDVDELSAPMRVVPGSHKSYKQINAQLARAYKQSELKNNIPQAGDLWEELLTDDLRSAINLTGKKGTVVLMNSNLLHAATENFSENQVRTVIISNFSKSSDDHFRKNYFHDIPGSLHVYNSFKNKRLVEATFGKVIREGCKKNFPNLFKSVIKNCLLKINKNYFRVINYAYFKFQCLYNIRLNINNKKYLNIGSGPTWRHPRVIGLDFSHESEVSFDLNTNESLPFGNDRFEGIYTSHCLEHLKESRVKILVEEFHRVLAPGGVLRITVPNIPEYFNAYNQKNAHYFNWIRNKGAYRFDSWLRLIVRAFAEPVVDRYSDELLYKMYSEMSLLDFMNHFSSEVESVNDPKYLWPNCHKSWWGVDKFMNLLHESGFKDVREVRQTESSCPLFRHRIFNRTRPEMSFYIEARKFNSD